MRGNFLAADVPEKERMQKMEKKLRGKQLKHKDGFRDLFIKFAKETGKTQKEIAEMIGRSQSSISSYINGRKYPSEIAMKRFEEIVGEEGEFSSYLLPKKSRADREIIATHVCENCCKHYDMYRVYGVDIISKCRECDLNKLI